jgi:hypothetical protein
VPEKLTSPVGELAVTSVELLPEISSSIGFAFTTAEEAIKAPASAALFIKVFVFIILSVFGLSFTMLFFYLSHQLCFYAHCSAMIYRNSCANYSITPQN